MEKILNQRNTVIFVALLTLWRLYLSAQLQLHPDEAYYWLWSRHLDMAYFDHSPLVAYFIWLTTLISQSELWVRLSGTMVTLIASFLMWRLALQLFGSVAVAAGSVMMFNAYPLTMLGLIVMTPDIPVFLFWSLSVYLFWQIMVSHKVWLWYALGLGFGLALLSKYTAILLLPCLFLYLIATDDRRWLKSMHPYLAVLVAFLCFLPVVYWNSRHDWISFAFQFGHGLGGQAYSAAKVPDYIAGQALLTGPIAWLAGIYAALAWLFRKNKAQLFLVLTTLPVIVFFGLSSLKQLAGPNWPAFAYFSFSILLAQYFLASPSKIRRAVWFAALLSSLLLSAIFTLHAKFTLIPLGEMSKEQAVADTTNAFYGWRELGAELKKHPEMKYAIASSHQLAAEISYYTDEKLQVLTDTSARFSQFNLWPRPNGFEQDKALFVWSEEDAPPHADKYIPATPAMDGLAIFRHGVIVRSYQIRRGQPENNPAILK